MNANLKKSFKRWIPPILLGLVSYFSALYQLLNMHRYLNNNASLKNKYSGKAVYILGNGPSLSSVDLKMIEDECVITMNHFELHPQKDQFKIIAHCVGEPYRSATWEDPRPMLDGIKANSYWVNADSRPFFAVHHSYDVHYYLPGLRADAQLLNGSDLTGIALRYQSTSQMAINIALFLGFKNIYLLGFDHDWLVTRGHSPHFYEERDGVDKADLSRFSYIEMIRISLSLFEIYEKLASIAAKSGTSIVNLTRPSYLDVFPTEDENHKHAIYTNQ